MMLGLYKHLNNGVSNIDQDKHDLENVVIHYGGKIRNGSRWVPLKCVIHDDATASATINLREQIYSCFVCDIYGDVYELIMKKEGVGFKDAVNRAETITNGNRSKILRNTKRRDSLLPQVKGNHKRGGRYIPARYS